MHVFFPGWANCTLNPTPPHPPPPARPPHYPPLHTTALGQSPLRSQVELRPGDTVIDVGANIGLFALAAAEVRGRP